MPFIDPVERLQDVLDLNDPYALANWMVRDMCTTVANDLWHYKIARNIQTIAPIVDRATSLKAHKELSMYCETVALLQPDSKGNTKEYVRTFNDHMVVPVMDLEVMHPDRWDDVKDVVSSVMVLCLQMAANLPANKKERVI